MASPGKHIRVIVPREQETAYANTALAVSKATGRAVWDGAKVVLYDVADASQTLLRGLPIPLISEAVECLLRIWDHIGQVEVSYI
jgi:hypothetical protein